MESIQNISSFPQVGIRNRLKSGSQSISNYLDDGKQKNPIYVLDGVRAIACFLVIFFHLNLLARDYHIWRPIRDFGSVIGAVALFGQSGVVLFFILSGFLLFLPYAKSMLFDAKWPSLRQFYLRRVFRIVPGFYVALILIVVFFHLEYLHRVHWHDLWLFLTFRMDFPSTFMQINGPFWTLAIEFQFYMLLPIIAWVIGLFVQHGTLRWRFTKLSLCLLVVTLWGLGSRYWGLYIVNTSQWNSVIPRGISDAISPYIYGGGGKFYEVFAIGMFICIVYVYTQNVSNADLFKKNLRRISPMLFLVGFIWLFWMALWHFYMWYFNYTLHFLDPYQHVLIQSWDEWQWFGFACGYGLFMFALLFGPSWLKRPFEAAPLRWLGLISFSLYMWHFPLMQVFVQQILPRLVVRHWHLSGEYALFWLWTLLVIVPFSLFLYRTVEMPWMRLGEKLRRRIMRKSAFEKNKQEVLDVSENSDNSVSVSNAEIQPLEVPLELR